MNRLAAGNFLLCVLLVFLIGQLSWAQSNKLPDYYTGERVRPAWTKTYTKEVSAESTRLYREGTKNLEKGLYITAIDLLLAAVEASRGNVDAWDHLGICYRRTGQIDEAIKAYETSIQINPDNPVPYVNLALIYIHNKDFPKALTYHKKVVELDPTDPEGFFGLGNVYENMNLRDKAVDNYLKAAELYDQRKSPLIADAYYGLGLNYALKKPPNNQEAVQYFLKAKQGGHKLTPEIENFVTQVMQRKRQ